MRKVFMVSNGLESPIGGDNPFSPQPDGSYAIEEDLDIGGVNALKAIPAALDFADADARDAYFVGHASELVDGVRCHLQDTGFIQEYNLAGTAWVNLTALTKGPKGDTGAAGADGADGGTTLTRVEVTESSILTSNQMQQTMVTNYGMATAGVTSLPAISGAARATFLVEVAGKAWSIKPPTGEAFLLDGVALSADAEIDLGQVVGDCADLVRIRTGAAAYQWHLFTIQGTHTDGS